MENNAWQVFQTYNAYRLCLIGILLIYQIVGLSDEVGWNNPQQIWPYLMLMIYATCVIYYVVESKREVISYEKLVIGSAFVDLVFLNMYILNYLSLIKGFGILLNISIAALAIMLPGITSVFFAAFESILLLSFAYYKTNYLSDYNILFYAGVHGAGFFATALTSLALAKWIRKSFMLANRQSEEILSLQKLNTYIIDKMTSMILVLNVNNDIIYFNDSAGKKFKLHRRMLPLTIATFSQTLEDLLKQFSVKLSQKIIIREHVPSLGCLVNIIPYKSEEAYASVLIFDDQNELLQQANQLKLASLGRFTASIAHELRNPLGAISHASQLLAENNQLNAQQVRLNEIVNGNCQRMNRLVKNILQLSRQEKSHLEKIQLKQFLLLFLKTFPKRNMLQVDLELVCDQFIIFFDSSQLEQLLGGLFDNHIKYGETAPNKVLLHTWTKNIENNKVLLYLQDEGQGIASQEQAKIFEPFFTTSRTGIGLGLFIARELCYANQASISLSTAGKYSGACFKIELLSAGVINEQS